MQEIGNPGSLLGGEQADWQRGSLESLDRALIWSTLRRYRVNRKRSIGRRALFFVRPLWFQAQLFLIASLHHLQSGTCESWAWPSGLGGYFLAQVYGEVLAMPEPCLSSPAQRGSKGLHYPWRPEQSRPWHRNQETNADKVERSSANGSPAHTLAFVKWKGQCPQSLETGLLLLLFLGCVSRLWTPCKFIVFHPTPFPGKHNSSCSLSDKHQKLAVLPFLSQKKTKI